MEEIKKQGIENLKLSARANTALRSKGIFKIEDLTLMVSEKVYNIRNIGDKTAKEIIDAVHNKGLIFLEEKEATNTLETTIYTLGLSKRLQNVLEYSGCIRVKDICSLTTSQLNNFFGMGDELKKEIITKIHEIGYNFYDEKTSEKEDELSLEDLYAEKEKLLRNRENLEKSLRYIESKLGKVTLKITEINNKNR